MMTKPKRPLVIDNSEIPTPFFLVYERLCKSYGPRVGENYLKVMYQGQPMPTLAKTASVGQYPYQRARKIPSKPYHPICRKCGEKMWANGGAPEKVNFRCGKCRTAKSFQFADYNRIVEGMRSAQRTNLVP
jgi:hypothetical protein